MCSACKVDYFKSGSNCLDCPPFAIGWLLYMLAPIVLILGWFPFFLWVIAGGITPTLFVTYAHYQILAVCGGFAVTWEDSVGALLKRLAIVNFDSRLMLLDCWMRPAYPMYWTIIQLLPYFYLVYYIGSWRLKSWRGVKGGEPEARKGTVKSGLFMVNMLYLTITSKIFELFVCRPLPDGASCLKLSPNTLCYTPSHVTLMVISLFPLFLISIGWPMFMAGVLYIGFRRQLLDAPNFAATFGFLYKRFEREWYWWHFVVVMHKFGMVFLKIFQYDTYLQSFGALVLTSIVLIPQCYSQPFESALMDRQQSMCLMVQLTVILIGIFMSTENGRSPEELPKLKALFYFVFGLSSLILAYITGRDIVRYRRVKHIGRISAKHNLAINPKHFVIGPLYHWISKAPDLELDLFRLFQTHRASYKLKPHLQAPFLYVAKGCPDMLDWILFPDQILQQCHTNSTTFALRAIVTMLETQYSAEDLEGSDAAPTLVEKLKDDGHLYQILMHSISWVRRDVVAYRAEQNSKPTPNPVLAVMKQPQLGYILYSFLMSESHLSEESISEREMMTRALQMVQGSPLDPNDHQDAMIIEIATRADAYETRGSFESNNASNHKMGTEAQKTDDDVAICNNDTNGICKRMTCSSENEGDEDANQEVGEL